ncbi:MAG: DUF6443 domain-containing protein [Bacteroidales bacterium]|nr:DUF6443 domain-containing protein [Bacteroidales bacterium]
MRKERYIAACISCVLLACAMSLFSINVSAQEPLPNPFPSRVELKKGYASSVSLTWHAHGANDVYQYCAEFENTDTLTVNVRITGLEYYRDIGEPEPSGTWNVLARLWQGNDDTRVMLSALPFKVDMSDMSCSLPEGMDSLIMVLPPDRYMLEFKGISLNSAIYPIGDGGDDDEEDDDLPSYELITLQGLTQNDAQPFSASLYACSCVTFTLECLPLITKHVTSWNSVTESVSRDGGTNGMIVTRSYKDDFGRDYADHLLHGSLSNKSLAILHEYDAWGRKTHTWLPSAVNSNLYHADADDLKVAAIATYDGDQAPYSYTVYEQSPLNRVIENYGPGEDWQTNGKSVTTSYLTNSIDDPELICLDVSASITNDGTAYISAPQGPVAPGNLSVVRTEDEDGQVSYEFTDRLGRNLLTRQLLTSGTVDSSVTLLDTYYVYDGMDRLIAVVPPALSAMLSSAPVPQIEVDKYAYLYVYDYRGRQSMKKIPGVQWKRMVYDGADRLLYEQDGCMRQDGKALCHLYDVHGRECVKLICDTLLASKATCESVPTVEYAGASGIYGGYVFTEGEETLENPQVLELNYYDDYSFTTDFETGLSSADPSSADVNDCPTGQLTGRWCALLESGSVSGSGVWTSLRYDSRGRIVRSDTSWPQGGSGIEEVAYDFMGSPLERHISYVHHDGAVPITEDLTYTYDSQERLLTVSHSLNGSPSVLLQSNSYDKVGRLDSTSHGSCQSLTEQRSYNVRSQLTSLSSDLFTERLHYNDARSSQQSPPRYNGSISSMEWKSGEDRWTRSYDFSYDSVGRLSDASYGNTILCNDNYSASYAYDLQGNIVSLSRHYMDGSVSSLLDDLSLTYCGNRLVTVEDAAPNNHSVSMEFVDNVHLPAEYDYDANGNTISDLNSGISSISYDITNHPAVIIADSVRVDYSYLASGSKAKMSTTTVRDTVITEYRGNQVWRNGKLSYILFDGGYIDYQATDEPYVFYLKDHLGNNRVVATEEGIVLQTNHYYPFGMSYATNAQSSIAQPGNPPVSIDDPDFEIDPDPGSAPGTIIRPGHEEVDTLIAIPPLRPDPFPHLELEDIEPRTDQSWRFGGKELMCEASLNLYDFEARLYSPVTGRFVQVDPMAEKYFGISSYGYCYSSPIIFVDKDGNDIWYFDSSGKITMRQSDTSKDEFVAENNSAISFKYGTVEAARNVEGCYDLFQIRGDDQGRQIFEFLATNSDVEWSHVMLGNEGESGLNFITSSHDKTYDKGIMNLVNWQLRFGYTARRFDHSHPNNDNQPSGISNDTEDGDTYLARYIRSHVQGENIVFSIFTPIDGQYTEYDEFTDLNTLKATYVYDD